MGGPEWDGVDRRKKARKRWQIGIPRQASIGEILAVLAAIGSAAGVIGEVRSGLIAGADDRAAMRAELREVRCELRYLRARLDGVPVQPCELERAK